MIYDLFSRLYGNAVVFANLHGQRRIPYLPPKELKALRDRRLRSIVRYASETVPYYRNLFQRRNINPDEIKTVQDLDRLPLIDKETVRKDPNAFLSQSSRGRKAISFITSGTTGRPLTICRDQHALLVNIAYGEREREVISKVCGREFGYTEAAIYYPHNTSGQVWEFYRRKTFIPVRPQRLMLSVLDKIEHNIKEINRFQPDVLASYGSYLEVFFKILKMRGINMHLPKLVLYGADAMTDEGKRLIEEEFGIPVFSQYNAVEAFKIGYFCEERNGFHLHEDLCHVKIVNRVGDTVAQNRKGEVVISNLVNRGTVLLNYRLGDIGAISCRQCPCGRTFSLLSELEGRVEDVIFLHNGDFVHPRAVWRIFKGINEVLQYQLIQHEPERFELKLVTVDKETYQRIINGILAEMRLLLGDSAMIGSTYCQEIKRQKGGKFRPVMSLYKPNEYA